MITLIAKGTVPYNNEQMVLCVERWINDNRDSLYSDQVDRLTELYNEYIINGRPVSWELYQNLSCLPHVLRLILVMDNLKIVIRDNIVESQLQNVASTHGIPLIEMKKVLV
jgi:hypothetical protein